VTSGILLVDKPAGITSHGVVSRVRALAATRKVGHAGTLDPMATGLLVLGIDSSTRLLTWLVGLDKEYFATIRLGFATTTDDAEGEPLAPPIDCAAISDDDIFAGIRPLTGAIEQVPSSVSAIKVDGKRSYTRVREGETVTLAARAVTVSAFEVLEIRRGNGIDVDVRVECSSGTYIRALARDLGEFLGVGGHLTALRRSRIGPFPIEEAGPIDEKLMARLLAPADAASRLFPRVLVTTEEATALAQGKRPTLANLAPELRTSPGPIAAIAADGRLTGLIATTEGAAKVLVNFPTGQTG
jgi:tRNA pseudouridine55 synthase